MADINYNELNGNNLEEKLGPNWRRAFLDLPMSVRRRLLREQSQDPDLETAYASLSKEEAEASAQQLTPDEMERTKAVLHSLLHEKETEINRLRNIVRHYDWDFELSNNERVTQHIEVVKVCSAIVDAWNERDDPNVERAQEILFRYCGYTDLFKDAKKALYLVEAAETRVNEMRETLLSQVDQLVAYEKKEEELEDLVKRLRSHVSYAVSVLEKISDVKAPLNPHTAAKEAVVYLEKIANVTVSVKDNMVTIRRDVLKLLERDRWLLEVLIRTTKHPV